MANTAHAHVVEVGGETRRDFLLHTTIATGVIGTGFMVWPLVASMNPAADTLALSTTEVAIGGIAEGMEVKVLWQGKPVFIRHRTQEQIDEAANVVVADLRDPEDDKVRVQKPEWLILVGSCTHLGCIPLGSKPTDKRGDFGGWFCPCHGSHYDTSGRIRVGPAPNNLAVPPYRFVNDTTVLIG